MREKFEKSLVKILFKSGSTWARLGLGCRTSLGLTWFSGSREKWRSESSRTSLSIFQLIESLGPTNNIFGLSKMQLVSTTSKSLAYGDQLIGNFPIAMLLSPTDPTWTWPLSSIHSIYMISFGSSTDISSWYSPWKLFGKLGFYPVLTTKYTLMSTHVLYP